MRVGLLIDRWDPARGGAERAFDQLAEHLLSQGHEVHLFGSRCVGTPRAPFHLVRGGGWSRGTREKRLGRSMTAAANGVGCDVTVGARHLERVDLLWLHGGCHRMTLLARRCAARGSDSSPRPPRGRHRTFDELERTALEGGARRVLVPSTLVLKELETQYPEASERVHVVEPGVDLERFHPRAREAARASLRQELGLSTEARLVALPAANPRLKGLPVLLAALDRLPEPPALVVAGSRRCPRGVRRRRHVHWRAHLDPLLLAAGADLVCVPTWRDTFGLSLVEALACGTPVVTSRQAGAAERVRSAGGVVLEDPGDVERLAQILTGPWPVGPGLRQAVEDLVLEESMEEITAHLEGLAVS